jgi:hypothetical protein
MPHCIVVEEYDRLISSLSQEANHYGDIKSSTNDPEQRQIMSDAIAANVDAIRHHSKSKSEHIMQCLECQEA